MKVFVSFKYFNLVCLILAFTEGVYGSDVNF